ncbi:hypothetical protein PSP6_520051 [Paraburkholderia tropica]|nr:hypothetical protein PSP6_520051 [Paraburkholderia tropica]
MHLIRTGFVQFSEQSGFNRNHTWEHATIADSFELVTS